MPNWANRTLFHGDNLAVLRGMNSGSVHRNVPTYHTISQTPATAQNQLDYVFASRGFHESVTVRALNAVEEWGASDHCRLVIEIAGRERGRDVRDHGN